MSRICCVRAEVGMVAARSMRAVPSLLSFVVVSLGSLAYADETVLPARTDASATQPPADASPPPTSDDNGAARQAAVHLRQGDSLFAAGHVDAALEQFMLSNALAPSAEVLFKLGEAHRAKRDRPAAIRAYNAYLAVASTGPFAETARARIGEVSARAEPQRTWKRIIERPLTLEQGRIGVVLGIAKDGGLYTPPGMDRRWAFATRVHLGAGYGITNEITIGGSWLGGTRLVGAVNPTTGIGHISHDADQGAATIYAAYQLAHGPSYSVATNVLFTEDVERNEQNVSLGLSARYRLSHRLAVFTGGSPVAPTYSSKLDWTFNDGGTGALSISAGLEWQWSPRFYMSMTGNAYYIFLDRPRHRVSTSLITYVTINEHVDIGAYLDITSFGLDMRVFL